LSVSGTSTLNGNLDANGSTNVIGTTGAANTLTGATNNITSTTSSILGVSSGATVTTTSTQASVLVADGRGLTVNDSTNVTTLTGGATTSTLTLQDNQVSLLTSDGHGLTVNDTTNVTTLSGGTNSSTLTLGDDQATLGVGTATTSEITVLDATNNGTTTAVTIGGTSNSSNQLLATASGGTNTITANATDGTNTLSAATNVITSGDGSGGTNSITVTETQTGTVGVNTFEYGTEVDGGMLIDGDLGVNGNIYTLNDTANATVNVGNNGLSITGSENTVSLQADNDALDTNARANLSMAPTSASLTVNTDSGVSHGVTISQTDTVISGGTNSTSLTLDDTGATFQNDDTGGPAKVTGVANGTDDYDAVNMRQYRKLENRVDKAYSGIASVAALSAIPAPLAGKDTSVGIGYGNFEGCNAIAVGTKALIGKNNDVTLTAGIGYCENTTAISAGIGWSF